MKIKAFLAASLVLSTWAGAAAAATIVVDLGPSAENFTLYGQGAIAPGIGSFTVGQGSSVYDSGTNTSTFTLSGMITGGSPGFDSGTYAFITTYAGMDTPEAGPNAPTAQSNPMDTNEFFYDSLDPSTTMTLDLFGTPSGNFVIPVVAGGNFLGPDFSFLFVTTTCTGVGSCDQNTVGLTPGATIYGPVTISASFNVPEPATWALMLIGFAGLAAAGYGGRRFSAAKA
jgi:PEP-CTERM motif